MHSHRLVDPDGGKELVEDRHHDAAAADPQQPGQKAHDQPAGQQNREQQHKLARRKFDIHSPLLSAPPGVPARRGGGARAGG